MSHTNPGAKVRVRPLRNDDAPALRATCWPTLSDEQAHERVARALALARRGRAWPFVGLYEGAVVGFGQLAHWRDTAEIADLVVGERWQSLGVGTAIVGSLIDRAREGGFAQVEIGVAESNARALALYQRLGFTQCKSRHLLDLGDGPEPIVYLSRALHDSGEQPA